MSQRTDQNEARYDRMARSYRLATRLASLGTIGLLYRAAAGALEVPPGGSVADVGCGPATRTPYRVRRLPPSVRITGVDISREMIALARRGWSKAEFVRAPAQELELPGPVDAVVFCLCLSGLFEPERCVDRAFSFLRPGGQLVIVDSVLDPRRRVASFVIRAKAGSAGAEPDSFPLAHLRARLPDLRERPMQGGVYSLLTGRKPSA